MAQEIYLRAGGAPRVERPATFEPSDSSYGSLENVRTAKSPGFRYPGYLPYPKPLSNAGYPVPNQQSVDWPQAQLAPAYLPAGYPSVEPFVYPDFDKASVLKVDQYFNPQRGSMDLNGVFEAEENPLVASINVTGLLWLAGAGVLGYYTAKKGWDKKARAWLRSKI